MRAAAGRAAGRARRTLRLRILAGITAATNGCHSDEACEEEECEKFLHSNAILSCGNECQKQNHRVRGNPRDIAPSVEVRAESSF